MHFSGFFLFQGSEILKCTGITEVNNSLVVTLFCLFSVFFTNPIPVFIEFYTCIQTDRLNDEPHPFCLTRKPASLWLSSSANARRIPSMSAPTLPSSALWSTCLQSCSPTLWRAWWLWSWSRAWSWPWPWSWP